jgi:DNA recombination protein RmuC
MKAAAQLGSSAVQRTLDEKLGQTIEEGRVGRRELGEANARFELALQGRFDTLKEDVARQLGAIAQSTTLTADQLRNTLNERLLTIQTDNAKKLDEMRQTVDEKLHATLEQRLGERFKLVSERLEQVHAGLGEMKTLAGSVGDLKKVMSNVRTRGTWGEVQLGAIIDSILTTDQYARNVRTVPGSNDLVEFAIRLPGRDRDAPVWLPIDSKYPVEDYQRLVDAHDTIDRLVIQQATAAFEASIRAEARKIAAKYVHPPNTTDFAILFVPTEGLFAEALRIPGLAEALQNDHRVVLAGPTTLSATLNSLLLGFRTLAIEQRSAEVWSLLGSVKTEFRKFGEVVDSTRKSITAAANKFDELGRRTRAIERGLRSVEVLPVDAADTAPLLAELTDSPADDGSDHSDTGSG